MIYVITRIIKYHGDQTILYYSKDWEDTKRIIKKLEDDLNLIPAIRFIFGDYIKDGEINLKTLVDSNYLTSFDIFNDILADLNVSDKQYYFMEHNRNYLNRPTYDWIEIDEFEWSDQC